MNGLLIHTFMEDFENVPHSGAEASFVLGRLCSSKPFLLSEKAMSAVFSAVAVDDSVEGGRRQRLKGDASVPFDIPLPFPSVWIEAMNPEAEPGFSMMLYNFARGEEKERPVFGLLITQADSQLIITALYRELSLSEREVSEKEDDESEDSPDENGSLFGFQTKTWYLSANLPRTNTESWLAHGLAFQIFNELRRSFVLGVEKTNLRARVGSGKSRRLVKIKDIVLIVDRKEQAEIKKDLMRTIDWSHRWEVMGHWRKIQGLGKDQHGSYRIKGFTWVNPHVKGPENKPVVTKTRFVNPQTQVGSEN